MAEQSFENKIIYKTVCGVFGGNPRVERYYDDNEENHVDLLSSVDRPRENATSYSTLALSDEKLVLDGEDMGLRVELVGVCHSSVECFPNILVTAALCIINSGWSCFPGVAYPDVVSMYDCSKTMQHLMFVRPLFWGDQLLSLELPTKKVAWLMAIPISESEYIFLEENGPEPLEQLFEDKEMDLLDINRPPVV